MKKKAIVWQFFDRVTLDDGSAGVMCKLCTKHFKNHGNTTNFRSHISRVHPIQWDLATDGVLDEESLRKSIIEDGTDNEEASESARALLKRFRGNSIGDDEQSGLIDDENIDSVHLVQQSDEEWLEDVSTYRTPAKRGRKAKAKPKIKREVVSPTQFPSYPNFEDRQIIVASDSTPKDEYAIFGEYIGNKLRKFKSSRTRGNLQQLITTLLWQAEYGYFDNTEAVKRIILSSIQDLNTGDASEIIVNEDENEVIGH